MKNLKYSIACSCAFCKKEITTSGLARHHKKSCDNIGSIIPKKPRVAWNKGLTKEDSRVAAYTKKITELQRNKVANGTYVVRMPNQSYLDALSAEMSLRNRGGKSKWFEVSGVKVQGTWERDVAIELNRRNIKWIKPSTNTFIWKYQSDNNKIRSYSPDFYLPELDIWLEIKGHWWGNDKEKVEKAKAAYPKRKLIVIERKEFEKFKLGELVW